MANSQWFDAIPLGALFLITVALFFVTAEVFYRLGRIMQRRTPDHDEPGVGTMVGATLALLGFLLAFVSSTALGISNTRRHLVIDEANAIGTAYLRAGALPGDAPAGARDLLAEYVDVRLLARDATQRAEAISRSEQIHSDLWLQAEALAKEYPTPIVSLYLAALNSVIDLHTERINSELVVRLPAAIVYGLYVIGLLTMALIGLQAGYRERHNVVVLLVLVLVMAAVFYLIFDLERGQTGFIRVPQQALLDLQTQIEAGWP